MHAGNIYVSGFVRDAQTGEVLIGANVSVKSQLTGTSTDNRGYYTIKVSTPCFLQVSYIGYKAEEIELKVVHDSLINCKLYAENTLSELTVVASRGKSCDVSRISAKELMRIPSIGGKPDVIKALQLLPGVLTQSEGTSLMMVRGGEPGQNLYLLDNVPLIYVNHLGGLLSVFNPDMINSIDFYKGNFPARHGGKLSSIVDITQREGDVYKHQGSFSLGITDASVSLEGPLVNDKVSYIVTARKTLFDPLLVLGSALADYTNGLVSYGFHDINAKISYKPNEKDNLSINFYQGDDYIHYWIKPWEAEDKERNHIVQQWGNWLASARWNRVVSAKLYAENILSYSRYRNKSGQQYSYKDEQVTKEYSRMNRASVNDLSLRSAWKYSFTSAWNIDFGAHLSYLLYSPNYTYLSSSSTPGIGDVYNVFESAFYIDNKITISPNINFQPALRVTNYVNKGANFTEFEPRIYLSYKPNFKHDINFNYMRVSQTSHLVFTQAELLKREIWLPATSDLHPEIANQYSVSWNSSYASGKLSTGITMYYKKMEHLIALKEGYDNMIGISGIENKIEKNGEGIAYGAEFLLRKNTGNWTGSLAYAWSYSNRIFKNINDSNPFEFEFNRPHSITINANRKLSQNWDFNAVWIFQSGTPYTPVVGKYLAYGFYSNEPEIEIIYGPKNSSRMQPYHRLDVGFNHQIITRRGNKAVWTYSVYNVYNRVNPYSYYLDDDRIRDNLTNYDQPLKLYKISLFSFIPGIAYKVYFDFSKKPETVKAKKEKKQYNWLHY